MSDDDNIFEALLAVQEAVPTLPKDKTNPHYKSRYTDLHTIVEIVGPILHKHGLVWLTKPQGTHAEPTLHYSLEHPASGQMIGGVMPLLLDKPNAQGMGSAITYARRYALCAVLNLVADEDDDGQAASQYGRQQTRQTAPSAGDDPAIDEPGEEDAKRIKALLRKNGITTKPKAAELFRQLFGREPAGSSFVASLTKHEGKIVIARLEQGALPTGQSDVGDDGAEEFQHPPDDGEDTPIQATLVE